MHDDPSFHSPQHDSSFHSVNASFATLNLSSSKNPSSVKSKRRSSIPNELLSPPSRPVQVEGRRLSAQYGPVENASLQVPINSDPRRISGGSTGSAASGHGHPIHPPQPNGFYHHPGPYSRPPMQYDPRGFYHNPAPPHLHAHPIPPPYPAMRGSPYPPPQQLGPPPQQQYYNRPRPMRPPIMGGPSPYARPPMMPPQNGYIPNGYHYPPHGPPMTNGYHPVYHQPSEVDTQSTHGSAKEGSVKEGSENGTERNVGGASNGEPNRRDNAGGSANKRDSAGGSMPRSNGAPSEAGSAAEDKSLNDSASFNGASINNPSHAPRTNGNSMHDQSVPGGMVMGHGMGHGYSMYSAPAPHAATWGPSSIPPHMRPRNDVDNMSFRSTASTSTAHTTPSLRSAILTQGESLEVYRQTAKKSSDPALQLEFAKHLIAVGESINLDEGDIKRAKRNQEALFTEALKWIKKLSNGGSKQAYPDAQFFLAECYGNGSLGLPVDHDRAFSLYVHASKQAHPAATYRTAVCYEVGAGTKRDSARAMQFYRKAAALGDTAAMYKVGMILMNGLLGQGKNPREGVTWLKRAAAQADETTPHALHELGLLYEGAGGDASGLVIPDPQHAHELFLRAAQLGYAPSQYKLGYCYEYGLLNLPVDARRSIAWYTRAAEQTDPDAELALSGWYLTGADGVLRQSDTEAYLWARKAADKGLAKAEYAVGFYSENGVGVKPDLEEARRWYLRAAAQGNKRAIARIKELKGQMYGSLRSAGGANVRGHGGSGSNSGERTGEWRKQGGGGKDGECLVM